MKKNKISILFIFSFLSVFIISGCSQNTSEVICDYGSILCDVSTTICDQIPGVPVEVCNYLDLACYNLDQLCILRDSTESPKYQLALSNLQSITDKLRDWKNKQAKQ